MCMYAEMLLPSRLTYTQKQQEQQRRSESVVWCVFCQFFASTTQVFLVGGFTAYIHWMYAHQHWRL